jgi:hypothetical protein
MPARYPYLPGAHACTQHLALGMQLVLQSLIPAIPATLKRQMDKEKVRG